MIAPVAPTAILAGNASCQGAQHPARSLLEAAGEALQSQHQRIPFVGQSDGRVLRSVCHGRGAQGRDVRARRKAPWQSWPWEHTGMVRPFTRALAAGAVGAAAVAEGGRSTGSRGTGALVGGWDSTAD
jgi:hypothetical protein